MKLIQLSRGQFAKVDDEDFERVSKNKWSAEMTERGKFYASKGTTVKYKRKTVRMHRFILNAKKGQIIDHINGDTLDNRKTNLRFCTQMQNCQNRSLMRRNKTGYVGVHRRTRKTSEPVFQAIITIDKKQIHLGTFKTPQEASKTYNRIAQTAFGEFYRKSV